MNKNAENDQAGELSWSKMAKISESKGDSPPGLRRPDEQFLSIAQWFDLLR
jgi:hypothetical protein